MARKTKLANKLNQWIKAARGRVAKKAKRQENKKIWESQTKK
jgi:hypothetical protein